ncbi:hypothetical protein OIO90_004817 [Microbotryomycetes sp. JL221]|nr:hypothetical protein OIO90_004817 [Microbotryomycetes sp. JL221]
MSNNAPSQPVNSSNAGSELDRLWALLGELSAQLSQNRLQTEELQQRAEELKNQAVHTQTGFTLRRFNIDVSQEEFDSELERLNVQLVLENQNLQQENRQLSGLLKDYEGTLETIMGKFRAYAFATQQHHLDLVRHYENMLLSMPNLDPTAALAGGSGSQGAPSSSSGALDSPSSQEPLDPLQLHMSLLHLGSLIRKALRCMQGEDPDDVDSPMLAPSSIQEASSFFKILMPDRNNSIDSASSNVSESGSEESSSAREPRHVTTLSRDNKRDVSEGGYIGRSASTNPHYIPTTSTSSLIGSPPSQPTDLTSGGAAHLGINGIGLAGRASGVGPEDIRGSASVEHQSLLNDLLRGPIDEALEREIQIEQLRQENEQLRRLLGISEEMVLDDAPQQQQLDKVQDHQTES